MPNESIFESVITCPHCRHSALETMPTNSCQWFYVCSHCQARLSPKDADCCVFCSYGSVPCPLSNIWNGDRIHAVVAIPNGEGIARQAEVVLVPRCGPRSGRIAFLGAKSPPGVVSRLCRNGQKTL